MPKTTSLNLSEYVNQLIIVITVALLTTSVLSTDHNYITRQRYVCAMEISKKILADANRNTNNFVLLKKHFTFYDTPQDVVAAIRKKNELKTSPQVDHINILVLYMTPDFKIYHRGEETNKMLLSHKLISTMFDFAPEDIDKFIGTGANEVFGLENSENERCYDTEPFVRFVVRKNGGKAPGPSEYLICIRQEKDLDVQKQRQIGYANVGYAFAFQNKYLGNSGGDSMDQSAQYSVKGGTSQQKQSSMQVPMQDSINGLKNSSVNKNEENFNGMSSAQDSSSLNFSRAHSIGYGSGMMSQMMDGQAMPSAQSHQLQSQYNQNSSYKSSVGKKESTNKTGSVFTPNNSQTSLNFSRAATDSMMMGNDQGQYDSTTSSVKQKSQQYSMQHNDTPQSYSSTGSKINNQSFQQAQNSIQGRQGNQSIIKQGSKASSLTNNESFYGNNSPSFMVQGKSVMPNSIKSQQNSVRQKSATNSSHISNRSPMSINKNASSVTNNSIKSIKDKSLPLNEENFNNASMESYSNQDSSQFYDKEEGDDQFDDDLDNVDMTSTDFSGQGRILEGGNNQSRRSTSKSKSSVNKSAAMPNKSSQNQSLGFSTANTNMSQQRSFKYDKSVTPSKQQSLGFSRSNSSILPQSFSSGAKASDIVMSAQQFKKQSCTIYVINGKFAEKSVAGGRSVVAQAEQMMNQAGEPQNSLFIKSLSVNTYNSLMSQGSVAKTVVGDKSATKSSSKNTYSTMKLLV